MKDNKTYQLNEKCKHKTTYPNVDQQAKAKAKATAKAKGQAMAKANKGQGLRQMKRTACCLWKVFWLCFYCRSLCFCLFHIPFNFYVAMQHWPLLEGYKELSIGRQCIFCTTLRIRNVREPASFALLCLSNKREIVTVHSTDEFQLTKSTRQGPRSFSWW